MGGKEEARRARNREILDQISALTSQLEVDEVALPEQQPQDRARDGLHWAGCYPTDLGVEMMQAPSAQASMRNFIRRNLDRLEPGDLFAVEVLVSMLIGGQE